MSGLPFEYIEIVLKAGKLNMSAGGKEGELMPAQEPDVFESGNGAQLKFGRNTNKKVNTLTLQVQGMTFKGNKS